jgi:hypothetical protein
MKPGLEMMLPSLAGTLALRVMPELPPESYAVGDTRLTAALLLMIAQQAEKAADILASENAAMRAVFALAAEAPLNEALRAQLEAAAGTTDSNLRITVLEAGNAALTSLLITLHAEVEPRSELWAQELDRAIWAILVKGTADRMLELPAV